jgi:hypothetical protein
VHNAWHVPRQISQRLKFMITKGKKERKKERKEKERKKEGKKKKEKKKDINL